MRSWKRVAYRKVPRQKISIDGRETNRIIGAEVGSISAKVSAHQDRHIFERTWTGQIWVTQRIRRHEIPPQVLQSIVFPFHVADHGIHHVRRVDGDLSRFRGFFRELDAWLRDRMADRFSSSAGDCAVGAQMGAEVDGTVKSLPSASYHFSINFPSHMPSRPISIIGR